MPRDSKRLVEDRRAAQTALGPVGIARDDAAVLPTAARIKSFGIAAGGGVEHQQGLAMRLRGRFGSLQQPLAEALTAMGSAKPSGQVWRRPTASELTSKACWRFAAGPFTMRDTS